MTNRVGIRALLSAAGEEGASLTEEGKGAAAQVLQLLRGELPVHFVNTEAAGKVRDRLTILSAT